jgi:hypothetical protein
MHREPRVFREDTRQPVEKAGQNTPTLSLPPSHHCLNVPLVPRTYQYQWYRGTSTVVHVPWDHWYCTYVPWYVRYVRTYNVVSQLSDWKRAHMCTENHVCFGRIHGSQLREGANAGQHTPTLSLPPSHHCLDGKVYHGNRHYNVPWYHWYTCTYVRTYVRTRVPLVPWYQFGTMPCYGTYTCTYKYII